MYLYWLQLLTLIPIGYTSIPHPSKKGTIFKVLTNKMFSEETHVDESQDLVKLVKGLENKSYEECLRELGLDFLIQISGKDVKQNWSQY